jgi:hypothetical protein
MLRMIRLSGFKASPEVAPPACMPLRTAATSSLDREAITSASAGLSPCCCLGDSALSSGCLCTCCTIVSKDPRHSV